MEEYKLINGDRIVHISTEHGLTWQWESQMEYSAHREKRINL